MAPISLDQLAQAALDARQQAYAPYSRFYVGAALLAADGTLYTGCNVESAAYSATVCAERTALLKAVSEGARQFVAIAIAGAPAAHPTPPLPDYVYPCGLCRQMLYEFITNDIQVLAVKSPTDYKVHTLRELLPHGFSASDLG